MSDLASSDPGHGMSLTERLEHLDKLKQTYRALQQEAAAAKEDHDWFEHCTIEAMEGQRIPALTVEGVGKFAAKSTDYGKILNLEEFATWAREQGLGDEFLQDAPQKNRLNELVRKCLADGEEFPPGVHFYTKNYISITKE